MKMIRRLIMKIVCGRLFAHELEEGAKACRNCGRPAPLCEWCNEEVATYTATSGDGEKRVCRKCVGVP